MDKKRIKNILLKEWQMLSRDPTMLMMVTMLPLLILGEAIAIIWLIDRFGGDAIAANVFFQGTLGKLMAALPAATLLPTSDQVKVFLLTQLNLYVLLIPTMIAISSASFSIVEEKMSRSLEPLLATPVRTDELLMGKALAGAIPAVLVSWICAGIYLCIVGLVGWSYLLPYLLTTNFFLNTLLLAPLIAVLSFLLGVVGSSRAKDARNAQTGAFFIILPVFALIAVQMTGLLWLSPLATALLGVVLVLADIGMLKLAVRLFQRESIIIKWR
jgi:ABC-type Na+ efflux pump permease subunit